MTIYIRPDGTISGSNELLPKEPNQCGEGSKKCIDPDEVCWCVEDYSMYLSKLAAWKESCIDFEDQKRIIRLFWDGNLMSKQLAPNTIIENVDVETEVVEEMRYHISGGFETMASFRVLRIKAPQDK